MKPFYKSKEVWVLGIAVIFMLAKFFGLDFYEIAGEAGDVTTSVWLGLAPLAALIIRIFWTKDKIGNVMG